MYEGITNEGMNALAGERRRQRPAYAGQDVLTRTLPPRRWRLGASPPSEGIYALVHERSRPLTQISSVTCQCLIFGLKCLDLDTGRQASAGEVLALIVNETA